MRQVLTVAHARTQSADFVLLTRWERNLMRRLSWCARVLYEELVGLSNFRTGQIYSGSDPRVSYAMLIALLTPDQPAAGPRLTAPTLKQIRTALDDLELVGLVGRNRAANEGLRQLFLEVPSRKDALSRSKELGRDQGRADKAKKPKKINQLPLDIHTNRAEDRAGVLEGDSVSIPLPHESAELSTGAIPKPPEPSTPPGPISVGAALGEKFGPPRGADHRPLDAGTPPAGPSSYARRMRGQVGEKIDPPGGQPDAPQGGGAALPPSARIRRPRNTVLSEGVSQSAGRDSTSDVRQEGQNGQ